MEKLKNGMTVVVKENQDSRVVGIQGLAKERSLSEGKESLGITEILQRMFLSGGSASHPGKSLYQEFERMGAELKLCDSPNIPYDDYYNSPRFAYIRLKLVDTFFEKGLGILSEMIRSPNLTAEAFEEAKKEVVLLSGAETSSTPAMADRIFYDYLFLENPGFGRMLGDSRKLEQLRLEDVQAFYNKFYNPANLLLIISGNIPGEKAIEHIKSHLENSWGEAGWQPPSFTPEFKPLGSTVHEKMGKQQSYISLANTVDAEEKDMPALHILGNILSDRLAFNLREKQGLAYSVGMHFEKYRNAQWYHVGMGTRPENIERAIAGIREEIAAIRTASFEMSEVQKTINAMLGRRGMRRLDRLNQAYYVGMEVLDGHAPEADDQYADKLKAVTLQELSQLAKKVFQRDNYLIVIVE
jgi:predicted Zn-dependent peptidase